ncbi:extracellular ligand-binding receptor (plasmid) [Xanthobacter versatilis]|uniref:Extracellular ligand-binding receptor n=1 Tax=Xanthobacter autotrophicus (strain ATCC BAA-1158 / Py2) TaxID=78245 RepID=A7IQC6_XANP2|nr:extracellular ligand-binding receptor [Xanthobacter autotrophicus Py2]
MVGLRPMVAACALFVAGSAAAQSPFVKIGVLNDRTGIYADFAGQGSVVGAQMAVEDFRKTHPDMKVEIVAADHQNKADVGSAIARKWYDEEGVDMIVDVPNSAVALAVNAVSREKNKVIIVSGGGTSDLTGPQCAPYTIHWTFDTWSLAHGTGSALVKQGGDTWFFLTADYAFGHALERDTAKVVVESGGKVLGAVRHPMAATDFASFLVQAQGSKAKVIGLANAAGDTINAVKQASEFGITQGGQKLAGLLVFLSDVHSLGLKVAQGLVLTESFYWDQNEATRAFAKRFGERMNGRMPTMVQAGVYSAVTHYLKAVAATKSRDATPVVAWMKANPTVDPLFGKGEVRADGRHIHDMYLFEVKSPAESRGEWDVYKTLATIPAAEAFRPLSDGGCPLVKS